jgi:uncharacterized membrane protein
MEEILTVAVGIIIRFVTQGLKNWFKVENEPLKVIIVLALSALAGWGLFYVYPSEGSAADIVRLAAQTALSAILTQATAKNINKKREGA